MRILVHEFASGGGLSDQPVPATLRREGRAMLTALIADLVAMGRHQIVTTTDARFPLAVPPGVEVRTLSVRADERTSQLDRLIADAAAAWIVAPETGGCLEDLAARVESQGTTLIGSDAAAVGMASDKAGLAQCLAAASVDHPTTRVFATGTDSAHWNAAAQEIGFPVVVKPSRGAGCDGVRLARDRFALRHGVAAAEQAGGGRALLLQNFVEGVPASVSLLVDHRRAIALAVNNQSLRISQCFDYHGGTTPLEHPLVPDAMDVAVRTCEALGGLRGYVGVDVVLTDTEAVVIEVNPRLTTAYLGVRCAIESNVAQLVLDACVGILPQSVSPSKRIRFTSAGDIVSSELVRQQTR